MWTLIRVYLLIRKDSSKRFLSLSLSPNSDQFQISPRNINGYSNPEVIRINAMIAQGELSWYFNKFSPEIL